MAKPSQSTPIRLGIIGCGLISHAHGRASKKSTHNIRFVACASRRGDVAAAWAAQYGCEHHYTDYEEMLRREFLDGVVIASWPSEHRSQIEASLEANVRHILCEKALTTSASDTIAIWSAAERHGAILTEGFMYRHHEAIIKAADLVKKGAIGTIDNIHSVFHMFDPEPGSADDADRSWRRRAEAGGGVLHDFICYPVDAANRFSGSLPVAVYATGSDSEKFGVTNRMFGQIEYANGCVATVSSSRKSSFRQSLQLCGSEAILDIPFAFNAPGDVALVRTASPTFLTEQSVEYIVPQSEPHEGILVDFPVFKRQLENFAAVIRGSEAPRMTMRDSVINAVVLDALNQSYRSCTPVDVRIPDRVSRKA